MNGIIVVDKPQGFTSFDVVAKMRGICGTRKIGHGGTLDPMATGVLPVFVAEATKAVDLQPLQDKTYEAVLQLGIATDTGDVTGKVIEQAAGSVTQADFEAVLPRFTGEQQQLPPMYSAIKVDGKPLYKYAREGKEVDRKIRNITVYSIDFLGSPQEGQFSIRVHCSKGTYIRTLAEDIGKALGMPATLAALRRSAAGVFSLEDAHSLEQIQQAKEEGRLQQLVCPVEQVFNTLPRITLQEQAMQRMLNGVKLKDCGEKPGRYSIYGPEGFAGVAVVQDDGILRGEKLFYGRE